MTTVAFEVTETLVRNGVYASVSREVYASREAAEAQYEYLCRVARQSGSEVGGGSNIGPHRTGYTQFRIPRRGLEDPGSTLTVRWHERRIESPTVAEQMELF